MAQLVNNAVQDLNFRIVALPYAGGTRHSYQPLEALLHSAEFMEWYLPILRSDLRARERYHFPIGEPPLDVPLHITLGEEELDLDTADLPTLKQQWQPLTRATCEVDLVPGGHFFILERSGEVVQRLLALMGKEVGSGK